MKEPGQWFRDLGIRNKLLLCFFALIIIPCVLISVCSSSISSRIIEETTNRYSHDILRQTTNVLEGRLGQLETISFNIFIDSEVQTALRAVNAGTADEYAVSRHRSAVESTLAAQALYHDEISAVFVRALDGRLFKLDKKLVTSPPSDEWLAPILAAKGGTVWFRSPDDGQSIVLARSVYSIQTQERIGDLMMLADERYLSDVLENTRSIMNGAIYALDCDGRVVIDPDRRQIGDYLPIAAEQAAAYSFSTQKIGDERQYVAVSEPMPNGWRVVSVVPVAEYLKRIQGLRLVIFLIGLAVFLLSVFFAWQIARGVSKPVRKLTQTMSRFGEGDLTVRCAQDAGDEVGLCATAFNQMADNIDQLIRKVYEEQLMKRDAELKSLRMQINPHFLYNTLETINWMARAGGNDDVGVMAKSLGDLMRATINGKDTVRLSEEMQSLQNYIRIQKYRYGDRFTFETDVPPETSELFIPKLILQPLVENAISHGIEPAFDSGSIRVSARREAGDLLLTVSDNGVGMDDATIEKLKDDHESTEGSIGLRNVIKRLKALYGEPYGLTIQSELGEGTRISIKLPIQENIEEEAPHENGLL